MVNVLGDAFGTGIVETLQEGVGADGCFIGGPTS